MWRFPSLLSKGNGVNKVRNKFVYNDVINKIAHLRGLFDTLQLDILCLAEIKLGPELCEGVAANFKDCHCYFSCEPTGAHKHGVAVLARKKKLDVISYNELIAGQVCKLTLNRRSGDVRPFDFSET